jgi:hypothetical protein
MAGRRNVTRVPDQTFSPFYSFFLLFCYYHLRLGDVDSIKKTFSSYFSFHLLSSDSVRVGKSSQCTHIFALFIYSSTFTWALCFPPPLSLVFLSLLKMVGKRAWESKYKLPSHFSLSLHLLSICFFWVAGHRAQQQEKKGRIKNKRE